MISASIQTIGELLQHKARPHGNELISIDPDLTLDKAYSLMAEHKVRHIVVLDQDQSLLGIISERDLRLAADSPLLYPNRQDLFDNMMKNLGKTKAHEIMARRVTTVNEGEMVVNATKLMRVARVSCLPVVREETGEGQKVAGIITQTDLLDHLIRVLEPLTEQSEG